MGISTKAIGACMEVHKALGPGLLESAYQVCLAREMDLQGIGYMREKAVPVTYKGVSLEFAYRLDFVVEGKLILEIKSVDSLLPIHEAQLLTYLKLTGLHVGLLVNFNVPILKSGIRRVVHEYDEAEGI